MHSIEVFLVDAFTANSRGGNTAGVVWDADPLSDDDKLAIAKKVGYSETAFICNDDVADFNVSFYTVTEEVDFCGHATVAAFSTLMQKGVIRPDRYQQRTKAGILDVEVKEDGQIIMAQQCPRFLRTFDYDEIAPLIGIPASVLSLTQLPVESISTGLPDIIVAVPNGYLDKISIDEQKLSAFCLKHHCIGLHAFELNDNKQVNFTASCRNFAPAVGITEEAATGSASGALASYLVKHSDIEDKSYDFIFEQGRAMGCRSEIAVNIECKNDKISRVLVSGFANIKGTMLIGDE